MTSATTCLACNYTRQPTDDAPDWECPNCQKAYVKTARVAEHQEHGVLPCDEYPSSEPVSAITQVCTASALFTLAMMLFAGRPWQWELPSLLGWIGFMLGFGIWAISPYLMLCVKAKKLNNTARQFLTLLLGAMLIGAFGAYGIIDAMFIHPDAQGAIAFIVIPFLQWLGVCAVIVIAESKWAQHEDPDE